MKKSESGFAKYYHHLYENQDLKYHTYIKKTLGEQFTANTIYNYT